MGVDVDRTDRTDRPSGWARLSLPVRVTAAATLLIGLALAAGSALLVLTVRDGLVGNVDAIAEQRAAEVAQLLTRGTVPDQALPAADDFTEVQVLGPDGAVLVSTPELVGRPPLLRPDSSGERVTSANTDEGGMVRLFAAPAGPDDRFTVAVQSPLDEVDETIGRLVAALAVGVPVLLGLLALATYALVRFTLRTVERLRAQVAEVSGSDLHRRVDVPPARDEVRSLALTMNEVLTRLEDAAVAQRRFVADAAHELRSPLAALRAQLEVHQRSGDPSRWAASAPRMLADTERLGRLVDDLLALARLDESPRPRRREPVDLDEVVFEQVRQLRQTDTVPIRTGAVSAGLVDGDPALLTRVVRNLLDNAARHAATAVDVSLSSVDGQVELAVADDGPGIPAADRLRVFRRFERLDAARARDRGGSGLGLAIVHDAVSVHGGTVEVQDNMPGARMTVWLPAGEHGAP